MDLFAGINLFSKLATLFKLQQSSWNYIVFLNVLQGKSLRFTCILILIKDIVSFSYEVIEGPFIRVHKVVSTTDYRSRDFI